MLNKVFEELGDLLTKHTLSILLLFVIVLSVLSVKVPSLRIKHDLQDYFPREHTVYSSLEDLWRSFGRDDNFLLIAVPSHSGTVVDSIYLETLKELTVALRKIEGVKASYSIATLFKLVPVSGGWIQLPIFQKGTLDTAYINRQDLLRWFISTDGKSSLIVLHIDESQEIKPQQFVDSLISILNNHGITEFYVLGRVWTEFHFLKTTVSELVTYTTLGVIILAVLIYLFFSSIRIVIGVVTSLVVSIIVTTVWLSWTSPFLPAVSPILFTIILIVSVSDMIHITHRFMKSLEETKELSQAIKITLKESGIGVFLTSITTASGFLALIFNPTPVIQWLGIHTAVSIILVFLTVLFFYVPLIVMLRPKPTKGKLYVALTKAMGVLYERILSYRTGIWLTMTILGTFLIISMGAWRLRADTYLLADVSRKHPSHIGFSYINDNFLIGRFQEFIVKFKHNQGVLSPQTIKILIEIEESLRKTWEPRVVVSPVAILRYTGIVHQNELDTVLLKKQEKRLLRLMQKLFFAVTDSSGKIARFRLMIPEMGSRYTQNKVNETISLIKNNFSEVEIIPSGFIYAFDHNNIYLSDSLWMSLSFVVLLSLIIVGLIMRNLILLAIFLFVNVLPLFVLAGIMGFMDITLRATTAMLFSISFGIAVDDTTHLLSNFYLYSRLLNPVDALKKTYYNTAVAMSITTIAIVSVLGILLTSDFLATRYIAIFLSITLLSATILDLVAVPVFIRLLLSKRNEFKNR